MSDAPRRQDAEVADLTFRPANQASWEDLDAVLGRVRCHGGHCYCQRFKLSAALWGATPDEERAHELRADTDCGYPDSGTTSGLVAYAKGDPVGWCAVQPRAAYPGLRTTRIPWAGRAEQKDDPDVWAITCVIVRLDVRRRGFAYALIQAAVDFARQRGAGSVEGYSMITTPGQEITWGELHVGSRNMFAAAGLRQVSRPTKRRAVMRIDFDEPVPANIGRR